MIKSGAKKIPRDPRDFDLLKTRKLGIAKMPELPPNFDIDAHLSMPDQNADGKPFGCTGYTTTEICTDEDGVHYDDIDFTLSKTKGYDPNGGADIRESLSTAVDFGVKTLKEKAEDAIKHKREAYFRITAQFPFDWFDAIRVAMWITQDERRAVSMATPWYPEWMNPQKGIVTTPISTLAQASWHNWKVVGWKMIDGKSYLIGKTWQGKNYGDNGLAYFSREIINNVMVIRGTGAFTLDKVMPPDLDKIKTVDLTVVETLVKFMQNLLSYIADLIKPLELPPKPPEIAPLPPEVPKEVPKVAPLPPEPPKIADSPTVQQFCEAIKIQEGWFAGSRSQRNHNPGNCKYSSVGYAKIYGEVKRDRGNFAIFKDDETGMLYLRNLVIGKIKKAPEETIVGFFEVYAPSYDGNNPVQYARAVAGRLGVGINYQLKNLI